MIRSARRTLGTRSTRTAAVLAVVLATALAGCASSEPGSPAAPSTTGPSTTGPFPVEDTAPDTAPGSAPAVVPEGFVSTAAVVTPPDGDPCEVCLWLADTRADRARGLMGVTDLGDRDGMAFVFGRPTSTSFTMRDTLLPLSIVFYDADGVFLDAFDMTPCIDEPCVSYPTPDDVTVAVEVPLGGAEVLGMVPGSTLELLPTACP